MLLARQFGQLLSFLSQISMHYEWNTWLQLVRALHLPIRQIEQVLSRFEKEGIAWIIVCLCEYPFV